MIRNLNKKELYEYMKKSSRHYRNYILNEMVKCSIPENLCECDYFNKKCNLLIASINLLLAAKDKLIIKGEVCTSSLLSGDNFFNAINDIAVVNKDKSVSIGEKKWPTSETLINELRNKLGHGSYVVDNSLDFLTIYFDQGAVCIPLENFVNFVCHFLTQYCEYRKVNNYVRELMLIRLSDNDHKKYATINDFDNIIDSYQHVKFYLSVKEQVENQEGVKYTIDQTIIKKFEAVIDKIQRSVNEIPKDMPMNEYHKRVTEIVNYNVDSFNIQVANRGYGVELKYQDRKISETEKEILRENYRSQEPYKDYTVAVEKTLFFRKAFSLVDSEAANIYNTQNLINYIYYLVEKINCPTITLEKYITKKCILNANVINEYGAKALPIIDQDFIGFSLINELYGLFGYSRENFDVDYTVFDFSKMDIEVNIDNEVKVNTRIKLVEEQSDCAFKKALSIRNSINVDRKNIEGIKLSNKITDEEKKKIIETLSNQIYDKIDDYNENCFNALEKYQEYKEAEAGRYNLEQKVIATHIRNSISHHRYIIIPGKSLLDAKILFEDYNEDNELVFKASITLESLIIMIEDSYDMDNEKKKVL